MSVRVFPSSLSSGDVQWVFSYLFFLCANDMTEIHMGIQQLWVLSVFSLYKLSFSCAFLHVSYQYHLHGDLFIQKIYFWYLDCEEVVSSSPMLPLTIAQATVSWTAASDVEKLPQLVKALLLRPENLRNVTSNSCSHIRAVLRSLKTQLVIDQQSEKLHLLSDEVCKRYSNHHGDETEWMGQISTYNIQWWNTNWIKVLLVIITFIC